SVPLWQVGVGGPFETPLAVADTASRVRSYVPVLSLNGSNTLIVYTPFLGGSVRSAWPQTCDAICTAVPSGSKSTQHATKFVPLTVPVVIATVSPPIAEKV